MDSVPTPSPVPSRLRSWLPALLLLLGGVGLSLGLFAVARNAEQRRLQLEFDNLGHDIQAILQSQISAGLGTMRSISDLYASSREVDRLEFKQFTKSTLSENEGFRGLLWVARVRASAVADHEKLMLSSFKLEPGYKVLPGPGSGDTLFPIVFLEPENKLASLRGADLASELSTRGFLQYAVDSGDVVAILQAPQFTAVEADCMMAMPLYKNGETSDTLDKRRNNAEGIAIGLLNFHELIESAARVINLHGQHIFLTERDDVNARRVLYESRRGVAEETVQNKGKSLRIEPWRHEFTLGGRQLLLTGVPTRQYLAEQPNAGPWAILCGSLVLTVLVVGYVRGIAYRAQKVEGLVAKRTLQLKQSEERHRAVVEQAAEGITLVDAETLRLIEVNDAFARLLGYPASELIGRPIADFIVDTAEGVAARAHSTVGAGQAIGNRQYRRQDGTIVDVEKSAVSVQMGGRRVLVTVIHDITERKRAQQLLEDTHRQLQQAFEAERHAHDQLRSTQSQLVQAEKLAGLGQMVAGVAHEINNPLSFVANNVAVLQRDLAAIRKLIDLYQSTDAKLAECSPETVAEIKDLVEHIDLGYVLPNIDDMLLRSREGLRRIQQIVKDLRDFARLDEGELKDADLNAGIQSTANIILGRAKKKQVTIDLHLNSLPLVMCHAAKVNQVVMNLMSNAIDASPTGGVVTVRTDREEGGIRIEVADQGPGVPEKIRQRIFDPFFTTKPLGEGTGLGLSISYGIINDHGGRIELVSPPGQGATFIVHLPLVAKTKSK